TLLFVLSLLAHEAGHVLTALLTGTRLTAVGFCLWGAYTRRERAQGAAEILIAAAGPAVNLLLVALLFDADGLLGWVAQMNTALAIINLVPIGSSDGRRILSTIQ